MGKKLCIVSMELSLYHADVQYRSLCGCTLSISGKGPPLIEYYFSSGEFSKNHVMAVVRICFLENTMDVIGSSLHRPTPL